MAFILKQTIDSFLRHFFWCITRQNKEIVLSAKNTRNYLNIRSSFKWCFRNQLTHVGALKILSANSLRVLMKFGNTVVTLTGE